MKRELIQSTQHDFNIDILRLAAMLMVVILHVARTSGALDLSLDRNFSGKMWSNLWESLTIYAVNIYALITGYLCYRRAWVPNRFFYLWGIVLFYGLGIELLHYIFLEQGISYTTLLSLIIPTSDYYWYVSAYTVLFFLIPFINKLIDCLDQKAHFKLILMFVCTLSIPAFYGAARLAQDGHNALWLIVMYICGAYIQLYPPKKIKLRIWVILYITCVIAAFATLILGGKIEIIYFRRYTSPVVFMGAIAFFMICIGIPLKGNKYLKIFSWMSPLAFSVYLIHCHHHIWQQMNTWLSHYGNICKYEWWFIPVTSIIIFIVCILADCFRVYLFKLLKVKEVSIKITDVIIRIINHTVTRLMKS